jgi:hypothetical protein
MIESEKNTEDRNTIWKIKIENVSITLYLTERYRTTEDHIYNYTKYFNNLTGESD